MDLRHLTCCAAVFALLSGVDGGCSRNQWQCDDGVCVSHRWRCDGVSDCQDGSDEMDCVCQPGDVECADCSGCVIGSGVCDGRPQCPDASDEWDCSRRLGCLSGDWKCKNSICIPQELLCNDVNDCGDNSDEETCGSCGKMNIRCPDGTCLTPRQRCDGVAQCSDKRDEPLTCGKSCHNGNGGCSHTCIDQLWGSLCTCPTGMTLSANGLDCEDVNECAQSFGPCMHLCTNTPGSFQCLCQNGFKLLGNGSCEAQGAVTKILTTRKGLIGLVNVKTRVYEPLFASESDPIAMTYNIQRSLIYWADKDGNIYQALNRKGTILYSGQSGLHSLAIDWLTGQLYWTSVTQKAIYTGAADGSAVGTVMSKEMDPRDMVLSPTESFIFWINKGTNDQLTIERVEMDGLNRTTLVFITAQLPRSLTMDVAARRLYWISVYKASIESIRTDGTGRHTFWDFFQGRPAQILAVFNGWFYLADEKKLWQAPQNMSSDTLNGFILKASLPVLSIYHVLQQPQGFAPCKDSGCQLCLPSKKSAAGFTCLCPEGALPMSWGSCENFKVAYATTTAIYSLVFAGETPVKTELFTSDEDIQSFDMYWRRGCVVWSNGTGHVKTNIQSQDLSEYILTLKPACIVRVDQRTGNLYWLACDELSIGVSTIGTLDQSISRQLYQARTAILDLFVDWQRGKLYWLEGGQVMRMKLGLIGGNAEAIFSFEEDGVDRIVFDRKANGFLWNMESYLQVMSLLKMRRYSAGKDWVVPGSIMAAYEPYMVTLFNNILTVWNRKDGARVSGVAVENGVVSLSVALREVQQDTTAEDVRPTEVTCKSPLVICHGSTVCISRSQRCDGNRDCPDGSDEASCVHMCAKPGDFLCKDGKKCVERDLVCDGRSHCIDGSDEVGCPTASETVSAPFRCRVGSKPCKDGRECVLYSHVCDGEMDCKDGSDEQDCEYQCKADQFQCAHGRMCIDRKRVCDGTPQCQDRSDELDCFSRSLECKHQCDNKTRCIPESFLCDGEKDCVDATDEANCSEIKRGDINLVTLNKGNKEQGLQPPPPVCRSPSMMCPGTSLCISQIRLCDGKIDCPDGSDEVLCVDACSKPGDFLCKDRRKCIDGNLVCDGHSHCLDGSDEMACYMAARNSKPAPFRCRVGSKPCKDGRECVLYSHVCDGEMDCKDGSDERDCEYQCKADQFQCAHGRMCIDRKQVCDGTPQCQDRSDELDCFSRSHECKHQCDNKTRCIPESFLCDGEKDCVDATDEANCSEIKRGDINLVTLNKGNEEQGVQPPPPVCRSPSMMCPGTSLCISQIRLCDGKIDCPDGSDEVSCVDACSKPGDFLCKDRRKCIDGNLVCDGHSHCLDGSDEMACYMAARNSKPAPLKCRVGSKPCKDGRECVLYSHVCDGEIDCKDGSDEQDCGRQCQPGLFQCTSGGRCIEMNQVCDGSPQCLDKSDEAGCWKPSKSCSMRCDWDTHCIPKVFICNGIRDCLDGTDEANCAVSRPAQTSCKSPSVLCPGTSVCVSRAQLCDGRRDCPDGSDEASCIDACAAPGDFLCEDRRKCIEESLVCDGRAHCLDGSDEVGCSTIATKTTTTAPFKCRVGTKPCKDGRECVLYSHVCDGEMDCKDGSDEEHCELQCNPGMFQCIRGKKCIDFRQVCDGTPQCPDHSDEAGCWKPTKSCSIRCDGNSRCIPEVFICNGMRDCWDGSDEADCAMPTPPSPCKSPYVACQGTSLCILQQYLCDGRKDCPDGSDERPCLRNCPYRSDFMCKDRTKCVKRDLVCDGRSHCLDRSDEMGCATTAPKTSTTVLLKCRVGSKPCKDGRECVLYSHVCDGEMDCKDGSDEADCVFNCKAGEFQCAHGRKCIDSKLLCDGKPQCQDFSDERDCFIRSKSCSHRCDNKTRCIPENFLCDGEKDCVDGTDESDCGYPTKVVKCESPAVLCRDGSLCIPHTMLCDGKRDCPDGYDETFCLDRCPNTGDFLCKDRKKCVERDLVCDGRSHCIDGSDEVGCPTASETVSAPFRCRVGSKPCKDGRECVLYSHVCDGEMDCKDGSDEQDCEYQCKADQFQCAHGRMCIDRKQVCDGTPQCQDRSDELDCFSRSHECKHQCDNKTRCIPESFLCDGEKDCVDATDEANCAPTTSPSITDQPVCFSPSVFCHETSKCISQSQLCDGKADCPSGADEQFCIYSCPDPGQFLCKDRRKCVERALVCDGQPHCADGSDEKQCPTCALLCDQKRVCLTSQQLCDRKPDCRDGSDEKNCYTGRVVASAALPLKCSLGSKPCSDGKECVLYSHVCDGEKDCKDGSDERNCERKCKKGQFQCAHGRKCIDMKLVCDGTPQCQDRSDEINCMKLSEECRHPCDNKTRCVPETFLCDGERDCADGTDEVNCVVEPCSDDWFQCSNGQCVALALRCDGYADCRDHSDEKGCPQPPHCPVEQRCPHTHECLLNEWLCDGDQDCSDGSDERNCKVTPLKCREFQWSCVSKTQCIATNWRCDGVKDCKDESDESGCGQVKCPTHLFQCGSGECVDPDLVCNKASDCADGSDEGLGCLKNNCSSPSRPSCQHYCINTPHGARCGCKTGFRLQSDGLTCNDINECKEIQPAACSHKCLNTLGSYLCQCDPEFILEPDGHSCKTAEEPSLLISEQYELLNLGLRSSSIQALIAPGRKAIFSLDYDRREQRVYWVSLEEESIKYAFHGIKDNIGTIVKGVKSDSIAIDWMGRNLYWVDGVAGQILAVRLTSSIVEAQNYITVVDKDLHQPRSLVLLPQKGIMFWSEIGGQAQIERSGMDGSDREVVVSRGLERPVSVTVDILTDRLYWTDEKLRCIGSATLDGENIRLLQLSEMPRLFSVAVFNDMVYWSDTRRRSVQGANKLTGKNRKVLLKRPGQPFDLKVVHPLLQPNVSGPCEKLRCSHVCLLAPGLKAVCRCQAGLLLAADGFTCATPVDSSSSFLMLLSPTMITQIFTKSLQAGFGLKTWPEHRALALPAVNEASDFDLLRKDSTISVADAGRGSVAQLKLSGSGFTPIGHVLQLKGDLVTALAVDWVTRNLYWSSVKSPQLYVTSPGGKYTSLVLPAELEGTISIALHPPTGRLCFTAVGRRAAQSLPQVDCAHMDGSNRTLLWRKAKMPASLAFSEKGTTLYWADIGNEMISSINMDGSNYKEYSTGSAFIVSFARVENIYFWITLDNGTAEVWYTDGFQPKLMWFEVKANVIELKAYSRSSQKGTNVCSENNGGCSHLCLPYPGGRSCRCAQDYLSVNKTKCVSNLKCPAGSKACRDSLTCIPAAKFCDQIPDCQDGSDEECGSGKIKPGVKSKSGPDTAQSDRLPALGSADGSKSCEAERCSSHGTCVSVEGEPVCECEEGYSGDLCQNAASSSTALALTLTFLFGGALMAAVVLKRRRAQAVREEATEKETLVTDVEERTTYSQNFANELYDPEEASITPAITTPVVS
ncbi:low-density lipoprotein receptor-related protein 2 isoform X1 [Sinocyclocheilus anshuiensis]|nr:PREDICTED: low-density lipoprotein receptor-related protein 2-like isoform X1 [Sinocyclocheilus anshuiensis]